MTLRDTIDDDYILKQVRPNFKEPQPLQWVGSQAACVIPIRSSTPNSPSY
jgi:hypothetical protein